MPRNGSRSFPKWRQHCGWNVPKLTRTSAAEFSFFLAVPTMFGATAKNVTIITRWFVLTHDQINLLIIGNVIALSLPFSLKVYIFLWF
jgi:undecaprenyl pyrophosphate phosphatase UppP